MESGNGQGLSAGVQRQRISKVSVTLGLATCACCIALSNEDGDCARAASASELQISASFRPTLADPVVVAVKGREALAQPDEGSLHARVAGLHAMPGNSFASPRAQAVGATVLRGKLSTETFRPSDMRPAEPTFVIPDQVAKQEAFNAPVSKVIADGTGREQQSVRLVAPKPLIAVKKQGSDSELMAALRQLSQRNPEILASSAGFRAASEKIVQARAAAGPIITGSLGADAARGFDYSAGGATSAVGGQLSAGFTLDMVIFDGFRAQNRLQSATAGVESSRAATDVTKQEVQMRGIAAYADVLHTDRLVQVSSANLRFAQTQHRVAEAKQQLGDGTIGEVVRAGAEEENAAAGLERAMALQHVAAATYKQIFQREPAQLSPVSLVKACIPRSQTEAVASALSSTPRLAAVRAAAEKADFDLDVAKGAMFPTVKLSASLNRQFGYDSYALNGLPGVSTDRTDSLNSSIGVRLSIPLYDGGATSSAIREALEISSQRRLEIKVAWAEIEAATSSVWNQYIAARRNMSRFDAQFSLAAKHLDAVLEEFEINQKTLDDVFAAQMLLVSAAENKIGAERDAIVFGYDLALLTGCPVMR